MHLMTPTLFAPTKLLDFVTSSLDLKLQDVFRIRVVHDRFKQGLQDLLMKNILPALELPRGHGVQGSGLAGDQGHVIG